MNRAAGQVGASIETQIAAPPRANPSATGQRASALWLFVCLMLGLATACAEHDDVVGTLQTGPDVSFLYDGGVPACAADKALDAAQLNRSWLTVARQCELPMAWIEAPSPVLAAGDGSTGAAPTDPLAPDGQVADLPPGWQPDYRVLLLLLVGTGPVPAEGEAPCIDPTRWYIDSAAVPEQVVLCPDLCERTRAYVVTAIDLGCRRLATP